MSNNTIRIHHFGLTVADIEISSEFYKRLGFRVPTRVNVNHYRWFGEWVGHPGAKGRVAFMQLEDVMFELHQYDDPKGLEAISPSTIYRGCPHIAIQVRDLRAIYAELKAEKVDFLNTPTVIDEGETPGYVGAYCRDPDGYIIELVQEPDGVGKLEIDEYAA